jgi:hypothetical protein
MAEFVPTSYFAKAVSGTLRAGLDKFVVLDFDEMTEAIHDTPLLSVYPWGDQADIKTATDRTTFGGAVIQSQLIIRADLFAQQRSNLGEDMGALIKSPHILARHTLIPFWVLKRIAGDPTG